jgi:hypothetical protein
MTRTPFDQFSKQLLEELLSPLGTIERSYEIPGESRQVDIWFIPNPQVKTESQDLGLLGQIATQPCLLEPFRNPPSPTEIRNCMLKLFLLQADLQRRAKRDNTTFSDSHLPYLWILAPSASTTLLNSFGAKPHSDWSTGIYFLAEQIKTAIIAINQLPSIPETLWLRLLGKGKTQQQAIREVLALPDNSKRSVALQILANWKISLNYLAVDEREELLMQLSQAYYEWEEKTKQQAIQQGQSILIENLLKVRFGELDDSLRSIVPQLLTLPIEDCSQALLQLSREELLERFS